MTSVKHLLLFTFAATSLYAAPRIACDSPKYDFGTVIGQEKITREFVLWNRGDSLLKIPKIKDCCGVKSTITPMVIPPRIQRRVQVRVHHPQPLR